MCNMYLGLSLFHGTHERRENCMYVRQVLNGVSDGTQGMFMYASVCVCVRVFRMSLSIGVHTALLGHDGHLLHQNYHCRPLSSLRLLSLGSCRNLSGRLPLHLPK